MLAGLAWLGLSFVVCAAENPCGNNHFPCNDGQCIPKLSWCDSTHDCLDDSDEEYCLMRSAFVSNPNRCGIKFFLCQDGPCIPLLGRCDGYPSCKDASDEEDCEPLLSTEVHLNRTYSSTTPQTTVVQPSYSLNDSRTHQVPVVIQSDLDTEPKVEDITKGFRAHDTGSFTTAKSRAESWLLASRDEDSGWGEETPRALTALYLSKPSAVKNKTKERALMAKQLHLHLSLAMLRNQTEVLSLSELSSFINALLATCSDPRNFHGHNLVDILRHRTDAAQAAGKMVSPVTYWTLCISNATTPNDRTAIFGDPKIDRIGFHALVSLTASCISRLPKFSSPRVDQHIARRIYRKVTEVGLPENVYELALVIQALNEAKVNQALWKRSEALNKIIGLQHKDGSFGDVLGTYYALPLLSGKSLHHLSTQCSQDREKGVLPLEVLEHGKHFVQYSLYWGVSVEVSQSIRFKVGKSASILDVMRIAAANNPLYRFEWDMSGGNVYSIGGHVNDAEKGIYWTLYLDSMKNATRNDKLLPFQGDIRLHKPSAAEHIIYWFKNLY